MKNAFDSLPDDFVLIALHYVKRSGYRDQKIYLYAIYIYSSTALLSLKIKKKVIVDKHTPNWIAGWESKNHKKSGRDGWEFFLWAHFHIIVRWGSEEICVWS